MTNFKSVRKFMETFGQEIKEKAAFPEEKITSLRYDLIREELEELKDAIEKKDMKEVADALTDILYVTYGAGHSFGIDLDKCCLLYTSPSPRDRQKSRMPSSA